MATAHPAPHPAVVIPLGEEIALGQPEVRHDLIARCVPVHIVAAALGDDAETVLSTYAHLLSQSDEMAAERVAAALAIQSAG